VESLTKCASSSKVVGATSSVTALICGLIYCEISWRRGSCGNLAGGGSSTSGSIFEPGDGSAGSSLRAPGEGEAFRVKLGARSLYEEGGL
jgi:hypothetical protein